MIYRLELSNSFIRARKKAYKRGKDMTKLGWVVENLVTGTPLPSRFRDHALTGNYLGCRECHIEPRLAVDIPAG